MTTFTAGTDLAAIACGKCGGTYAIAERFRRQCQEEGKGWNCPYCKVGWGYGEGENAKLKRQLQAERNRVEYWQNEECVERRRAEHQARRASAFKGQVTKIKNRVGRGVCPCCNRTFENLARHMASQHPEWAPDTEPAS